MAVENQVPYNFQERFDDSTVSRVTIIDANTKQTSSGFRYHFSIHPVESENFATLHLSNPNWNDRTYQASFQFVGGDFKAFVNNSLRTENIYGEEQVGTAGPQLPRYPNGNYFNIKKLDDGENLIVIEFAIRSDIEQLQPIEFDIIFSNKINRIGTNYITVNITKVMQQL